MSGMSDELLHKVMRGGLGVTQVQLVPPPKGENHGLELLVLVIVHYFCGAWGLMLGMGAAHALWPAIVPAAGYWTCLLLLLMGVGALYPTKRRWLER